MDATWTALADEFLHLYPRGRRLLAVAGADAGRSRVAADELAAALSAAGQRVERAHSEDGHEQSLRDQIVGPFRRSSPDGTVLVVSGPAGILSETSRRLWNWSAWQLAGDEEANTLAAALVDMTDPARPARRYADFCECDIGEARSRTTGREVRSLS